MKINFHKTLVWLLAAGTAAGLLIGCQKAEEDAVVPERPLIAGEKCAFSVVEEDAVTVETKSVLDGSVESTNSGVTVGVYADGALVDKKHSASLSGIVFNLESGKTYKLYALANMGNQTSALPSSESSLSSFVYTIPAYNTLANSVETLGIPMAGSLEYTPGVTGSTVIPAKRLLAKVTANLSCDWAGAKIVSAKVYNLNAKLKPFGTSAATGASDMLSFQELESVLPASATNSLLATFYVPENMQGTVSGITASKDKSADRNSTVAANAAKLSYLEVAVESEGKYDGNITYRSYLGNNATTNFDIQRNYKYVWTVHYQKATVDAFEDDWKRDLDDMEIVDYSISITPADKTISVGSSDLTYTTTLTKSVLKPTPSSTSSALANNAAGMSWESSKPSVATVSATGVVTGVASGSATITARYVPSGPDFGAARTASADVTVQSIVRELELIATPSPATAGQNVTVTARIKTTVDGGTPTYTDVPASSVTWSVQSKTVADATVSVSSSGVVSSNKGTNAVIKGEYDGLTGTVTVVYNDDISHSLEITASPVSGSASVGETITLTAKYYTTTNGVKDAGTPVSVTWTRVSGSTNISVSASGAVTATAGGTATIQGSYTVGGNTYTATKEVTFGNVDVEKYRLVITPSSSEINWNETQSYTINRYTDIYRNGSLLTSGTTPTAMSASSFNWTSSATGVATVSTSGVATGVNGGTTTITAALKSSVADFDKYISTSLTASLKVNNVVTYSVEITTSPASGNASVGETITMTATLYTITNGVKGAGTDVTSSAVWTRESGSSTVTVGNSGSDKGKVTATAAGTAVVKAEYTSGGHTYGTTTSVSFGDVVVEKYRFVVTPASATVAWNATQQLKVVRYTDTYRNGSLETAGTVGTDQPASNFNWTSSAAAKATVDASGLVQGKGTGSATITATLKSGVSEYAKYSNTAASAEITVTEVKSYRLTLTADNATRPYNGTINLTARYYTTTNGVEDAGVVVTPASLAKTGGSNITLTKGNPSTAKLTNPALSVVANNKATVTATYAGTTSAAVSIEFTNVTTSAYTRLVVSGDASVSVGATTSDYIATLYTQTYVNGAASGAPATSDVSSSATFTSSPTGIATVSGRKATGVAAGTTYISASYTGPLGAINSASADRAALTVGNVEEDRYRLVLTPATASIAWNATQAYTVNRYTDHYVNGTKTTTGTTPTTMSASDFTWTSSATGIATVSTSGVATGKSGGSATITATLKSSVSGYDHYVDKAPTATLTVTNVVSHRLVLSADSHSKPYNGTISLTAKYYTTTNGAEDAGVNVTPSSLTKTSGGSNITLTAGNPSTAKLTNPALSVVANNKATVTATYAGTTSDAVSIEFTNVTTYAYTRLVVSGDASVSVGATTSDYTATLYTQTYVNGAASGAPATSDVSSSATFASSATAVATVSGRKATGVAAGTAYISASYTGTYGPVSSATADIAKLEVGNVITYGLRITPVTATTDRTYTSGATLKAEYVTYTNGSETSATDVSSTATWSCTEDSKYNVSGGSVTAVPTDAVPSIAGTTTVTASYSGKTATQNVTFVDVTELDIVNADNSSATAPSVVINGTKTFKALLITNGRRAVAEDKTSVATWTVTSGSSYVSNLGGGSFKGLAEGSAVIRATYSGKTDNVTLNVIKWQDGWDNPDDPEIDL